MVCEDCCLNIAINCLRIMRLLCEKSARTGNVLFLGVYFKCIKDDSVEWKCRVDRWFTLLSNGTNSTQISKVIF